ncbi:glycosyltransferase [Amylibacter sp.]|nr:glycosyltransferase [Amylibacter sp.]
MKISIITVVYNGAKFIDETLKSITNQDYPDIEYIVVDGNSTDATMDIIKKYAKYIKLIISEKDEGQTDALIKGIKVSSGEYICWLNYDDLFYNKSTISNLVNTITSNPGYELYYGDDILIDKNGRKFTTRKFDNMSFNKILNIKSISQPSSIFSKKAFDLYGLNKELEYSMDLDFFLKIFKNDKTFYTNSILSKNRIHDSRKMEAFYLEALKESSKVRNKHGQNFIISYIFYNARRIKYRLTGFLRK